MKSKIDEYLDYVNKIGDRIDLYRLIADVFKVKSALYPGSHIDISPSLVIPEVTYVDNFKGTVQFFKEIGDIQDYIELHKQYDDKCEMLFYNQDYEKKINIEKVDLIISQYAGFVGQATKEYLKDGGVLLCNDSHGDATLAFLDPDYEFIGVVDSDNTISTLELAKYFKFARERGIDKSAVVKNMKGPKYKHMAESYLFRKHANKL